MYIGLTGDVMIGRNVGEAIADKGFDYPWGDLLPLLNSTNLNIVNLETTLTHHTRKVDKVFNFRTVPRQVESLVRANMRLVNLANNHVLDFGEAGLEETIRTLDEAGIAHTGAGRNDVEAAQPATFMIRDQLRLAAIGFTDNEKRWKAGPDRKGINHLEVDHKQDTEAALALIGHWRPRVDFLVVSIHWGPNMRETPPSHFIDFAHALVGQGADIVHGHSAHIFQGIEVYQDRYILYDTGDFVDDYVVDPVLRNDHSFFYVLELDQNGIRELRLHPVLIRHCQVNHAAGYDREWCFNRVNDLSSRFGTIVGKDGKAGSR